MSFKLSVEQITAAVSQLSQDEKQELARRLPSVLEILPAEAGTLEWAHLAESAFSFWDEPAEDIYNDLIPTTQRESQLS